MHKRIVAIVNPVSGRRDMLPKVKAIARLLLTTDVQMDIHVSRYSGHVAALTSHVAESIDALLVVGGDGTVCEVVNGLNGRPLPMVILMTGTENLIARTLDMPIEIDAVAKTLINGKLIEFDVGLVNGRRFLAVAGVGFDAECVKNMSQHRHGHIMLFDYFWPIWRTFWGHRFPFLIIEADERVIFEGRGFAIVGNIKRYGAGLNILQNARFNDGLLDVCVFSCNSKLALIRHSARVLCRNHLSSQFVHYEQCRRVKISSDEDVPLQIDGDPHGTLPAQFSIKQAEVLFLG